MQHTTEIIRNFANKTIKDMRRILNVTILVAVLLSVSLTTDARRRRIRLRKAPAKETIIRKSELTAFAPLIFGTDSVVMDSPLRTMKEMGMESGTMIYVCTLPEVKAASVLTLGECHDFAQVFIDDDFLGQLDGTQGRSTLELPPVYDGQEIKIFVEAMGRKTTDGVVGLVGPVTLTADIDGNELTLNMRRWTILTVPDGYDTVSKALAAVAADSLALPQESGKAGYYRFQAVFSRSGDIFLDMGTFGRGQVFVNGNPLGYFSDTKPSLQVLRRYLKRGFNEVVVVDVAGPRQAVLSAAAKDQSAVGQ